MGKLRFLAPVILSLFLLSCIKNESSQDLGSKPEEASLASDQLDALNIAMEHLKVKSPSYYGQDLWIHMDRIETNKLWFFSVWPSPERVRLGGADITVLVWDNGSLRYSQDSLQGLASNPNEVSSDSDQLDALKIAMRHLQANFPRYYGEDLAIYMVRGEIDKHWFFSVWPSPAAAGSDISIIVSDDGSVEHFRLF